MRSSLHFWTTTTGHTSLCLRSAFRTQVSSVLDHTAAHTEKLAALLLHWCLSLPAWLWGQQSHMRAVLGLSSLGPGRVVSLPCSRTAGHIHMDERAAQQQQQQHASSCSAACWQQVCEAQPGLSAAGTQAWRSAQASRSSGRSATSWMRCSRAGPCSMRTLTSLERRAQYKNAELQVPRHSRITRTPAPWHNVV